MPRTVPLRSAAVALGLALATLPAGARASGPALEYGPEAEAQFVALCTEAGVAPAACRCVAERLQDRLGYPAFLAAARGGPAGFSRYAAGPTARFAHALAGAEAACGAALPGTVTAAR